MFVAEWRHIARCELTQLWRIKKMLTKIALATALTIGTACAALASNENNGETGGYRLLGPGGVVTDGVNPVFHPSMHARGGNAYGYAAVAPSQHKAK
jgi:hypothetical protein